MTTKSALQILIGINARLFPTNWRPALDEIAFAQSNGFSAIQFHGEERGLDTTRLGDPLPVIATALRKAGLTSVMEITVEIDQTGCTSSNLTLLDLVQANMPAIIDLPCTCVHLHIFPAAPMNRNAVRQLEKSLIPQFVKCVKL